VPPLNAREIPAFAGMTLFMTDNKIHIGTIRGAHGVKGLVRLAVFAEDLSLFDTLTNFKITLKNKHKGDVWLSNIDGVFDKDAADALKGTKLYVDRTALAPPTDDEIYFNDMIGMECVTENGTAIGTVTSIDNFGAGDLLDIKPPNGQNFFLSYDDKTILKIDTKITVNVPEIV
jgi:16S rRNA processing protein RimM